MTKEEAKQYIRNLIDSCIIIQDIIDKNIIRLTYNKQYLRAKKLSKITGQTVNQNNFKGGEVIFWVYGKYKKYYIYAKHKQYLSANYSHVYSERLKLIEEVLNEYEEYKGYTHE